MLQSSVINQLEVSEQSHKMLPLFVQTTDRSSGLSSMSIIGLPVDPYRMILAWYLAVRQHCTVHYNDTMPCYLK